MGEADARRVREEARQLAVPQAPGLSVRRVARLKRFDMDWQAALAKLDASKLSAAARADLTTLKTAVAADLTQLDSDAAVIAELASLMPFATTLLDCRRRGFVSKTWTLERQPVS